MGSRDVRLNSKDLPNRLILLLKNNWEESLKTELGFNDLRNFCGVIREVKHDVYGRRQTAKITSDFLFFPCNP